MSETREVVWSQPSIPAVEGAGVRLRRAFGYHETPRFDPFLMMDDFHSSRPEDYMAGFPWHPHRGIETITYLIEGLVEHGDSMGNAGVIGPGDVQWMTAGSGIVHQEMPKVSPTGTLWGIQLWANLPGSHKMMPPRYQDVPADRIPVVTRPDGARIRVVCGAVDGAMGPVRDIVTEPVMVDAELPAGAAFDLPVPAGHTAFAYVLAGAAHLDAAARATPAATVALYSPEGARVAIRTTDTPARVLLLTGRPLGEPIAWRGPIVMNTDAELRQAFAELHAGTFVRPPDAA